MNVEIGTETPIFLFWEYLFRNFGILSLQCIRNIPRFKTYPALAFLFPPLPSSDLRVSAPLDPLPPRSPPRAALAPLDPLPPRSPPRAELTPLDLLDPPDPPPFRSPSNAELAPLDPLLFRSPPNVELAPLEPRSPDRELDPFDPPPLRSPPSAPAKPLYRKHMK
jgi:hypothetical protein